MLDKQQNGINEGFLSQEESVELPSRGRPKKRQNIGDFVQNIRNNNIYGFKSFDAKNPQSNMQNNNIQQNMHPNFSNLFFNANNEIFNPQNNTDMFNEYSTDYLQNFQMQKDNGFSINENQFMQETSNNYEEGNKQNVFTQHLLSQQINGQNMLSNNFKNLKNTFEAIGTKERTVNDFYMLNRSNENTENIENFPNTLAKFSQNNDHLIGHGNNRSVLIGNINSMEMLNEKLPPEQNTITNSQPERILSENKRTNSQNDFLSKNQTTNINFSQCNNEIKRLNSHNPMNSEFIRRNTFLRESAPNNGIQNVNVHYNNELQNSNFYNNNISNNILHSKNNSQKLNVGENNIYNEHYHRNNDASYRNQSLNHSHNNMHNINKPYGNNLDELKSFLPQNSHLSPHNNNNDNINYKFSSANDQYFRSHPTQNTYGYKPFNSLGTQKAPIHPCSLPNDFFMSGNPWLNRKKRKNNPLLWQYMQQNKDFHPGLIHPSKYSSFDYIQGLDRTQKMFIGTVKRPQSFPDKNTPNYTVLPLFLNSTSFYENHMQNHEFEKIARIFLERTKALDYENVTVQQLKVLMKEFGLNHTGKKVDLIERVKQSICTLQKKLTEKKEHKTEQKNEIQKENESLFYKFESKDENKNSKIEENKNKQIFMHQSKNDPKMKMDTNTVPFDDQSNLDYLFF